MTSATYDTHMRPKSAQRPLAGHRAGTSVDTAPRGRNRLPDLASQDELSGLRIAFTSDSVQDESTDFLERAESHDDTARLTVYVLNAILFFIAFPVGFGMLIFNILGGENLRTTAHVVALTGMGTALSFGGTPLPMII